MPTKDFTTILLSDEEQKIFDKFKSDNSALLTRKEFNAMAKRGLVIGALGGKSNWFDNLPEIGVAHLSETGKSLKLYQKQTARKEHVARVRHWVPVFVSSLLSVIAIIISVIALLGELGILQLTLPK